MSQQGREASTTNGSAYVIDKNGVRGVIENLDANFKRDDSQAHIRTGDGTVYLVRAETLVELKDGGYFLPTAFRDMTPHLEADSFSQPVTDHNAYVVAANPIVESSSRGLTETTQTQSASVGEEFLVVPVIAEELQVGVRAVERGRVRITKTINEREEIIDEPLRTEDAVIERIEINRIVESAPPVRYEGDVMVVSLVEEVVVYEKKLILREELRVSKKTTVTHKPQSVVLRREEANVEHLTPDATQDDLLSLDTNMK